MPSLFANYTFSCVEWGRLILTLTQSREVICRPQPRLSPPVCSIYMRLRKRMIRHIDLNWPLMYHSRLCNARLDTVAGRCSAQSPSYPQLFLTSVAPNVTDINCSRPSIQGSFPASIKQMGPWAFQQFGPHLSSELGRKRPISEIRYGSTCWSPDGEATEPGFTVICKR